MADVYNLHRFLAAQAPTYDTVLAELRSRRKSSHWIWFLFPQITGLDLAIKAGPERFSGNLLRLMQDTFR
ncbi:MAG: DUF1810 family protein [Nitrospira sp.]|nr:DUF1810 family protein [Nitrospira sp.]